MTHILTNAFKLIECHLMGDYVLQTDFLAKTKGTNWYHLFAHCMLYCLPFALCFGLDYKILILFLTHIVIDAAKARYNKINYVEDQILHYIIALFLWH